MFILIAIKLLVFFYFSVDTSTKTVGYKEGSGFTHAYNDEPITFNPMEAHEGIRDVRCVMIDNWKTKSGPAF